MMYPGHIPRWVGRLFPKAWWFRPDSDAVYLTFDDGPTPGITERLLQQLDAFQARATFFTVGEQASRNSELLLRVSQAGHSIGNHTHHHLKANKTPMEAYLADISRTDQLLKELGIHTNLFRPPYGALTCSVYRKVSTTHRIVMWEWLTGDFDPDADPVKFEKRLRQWMRPGSILVLHDSERHGERMFRFLSPILEMARERGWKLKALPQGGEM